MPLILEHKICCSRIEGVRLFSLQDHSLFDILFINKKILSYNNSKAFFEIQRYNGNREIDSVVFDSERELYTVDSSLAFGPALESAFYPLGAKKIRVQYIDSAHNYGIFRSEYSLNREFIRFLTRKTPPSIF